MSLNTEHAKALVKIARAIERGTLPIRTEVRTSNGRFIEVFPPLMCWSQEANRLTEQGILDWLEKNFDGVTMQRVQRVWSSQQRRRARQWWDARSWQSSNDGSDPIIHFTFSVPHICRRWRSDEIPPQQAPVWRCQECRKPLTKTKARAMGLIP